MNGASIEGELRAVSNSLMPRHPKCGTMTSSSGVLKVRLLLSTLVLTPFSHYFAHLSRGRRHKFQVGIIRNLAVVLMHHF